MKAAIFFASLLCCVVAKAQNPFQPLKYDKVVAYEFNGNGGRTIEYWLDKTPHRIDQEVILTEKMVDAFERIITHPKAYGRNTAACFDPHFAVIYYMGDQKVAVVDVCLACNYLISSIDIPATTFKKADEGTAYERNLSGFQKEVRGQLDQWLDQLNFQKYRRPLESIFDE